MRNKIHRAKKSLGQNFLKSEKALNKIIEAGEVGDKDTILEIGPGKGALTEKLLEHARQVIAVEKDDNLFALLQEKFAKEIANKKLFLIHGDILNFDVSNKTSLVSEVSDKMFSDSPRKFSTENFLCPSPSLLPRVHSKTSCLSLNYKIIANIPYNITGAILKKFLTTQNQPKLMVLMVQKEVAERIIARNKKESLLSVSIKVYGTPKMIMKVDKRYFSPAPKVDSAIISIKNISKKIFSENKISEEDFWKIAHAGFAHKRKKLSSNLKNFKKIINSERFLALKNARAEELTPHDWARLIKID